MTYLSGQKNPGLNKKISGLYKQRVFLVVGSEFFPRANTIENIKRRILKETDIALNTQLIYVKKTNLDEIKDKLFSLSFEKKKLVIFKETQHLTKQMKQFLMDNLEELIKFNFLIFELEGDYTKIFKEKSFVQDGFFRYLMRNSTIVRTKSYSEEDVWRKFLRAVRYKNLSSALYFLEKLFDKIETTTKTGWQGLEILGALVKEFSRTDYFDKEKYFHLLWEADRSIKVKGMSPKLVIQLLLVNILRN